MKILQLNHVALHVSDLDASCRFYEQVLGLTKIDRPAFDFEGAWYELSPAAQQSPRQELHLIARPPENAMPPRECHIALLVESIERAEARLRSCGALFQPPKRRPDGAIQIFLRDPDGHVIELCSWAGMY